MIEREGRGVEKAIATMSIGESLDNASDGFDPTTYIQSLQFKLRCYEASGEDFQRLFEDIIKRVTPEFMQIRAYGNIGDRKCDGLLYADGTIFQVYSPDALKQAQLKKKINEDLDGAVKHWGETLKKWVFVYNVRQGLAPDLPKILQQKQKQYPNIEIDHWSNHYLWEMARGLSLQQRAEVLGAPVVEKLEQLGFKPQKNAVCQFLQDIEDNFKYIRLFHTQQEIIPARLFAHPELLVMVALLSRVPKRLKLFRLAKSKQKSILKPGLPMLRVTLMMSLFQPMDSSKNCGINPKLGD